MPCAVVLDAHTQWHYMSCCYGGMGIPFSVHIADAMAMELSLHVYSLFIYFVIGVCHPEKGCAMNLMNPKDLCTVGELLAQDCSRRAGRS